MNESLEVLPRVVKRGEEVSLGTMGGIPQSRSVAVAEPPSRGEGVHGLAGETGRFPLSAGEVFSPVVPSVWTPAGKVGSPTPPIDGRAVAAPWQRRSRLPGAVALGLYELEPHESDEELPELDLGLYDIEEQS